MFFLPAGSNLQAALDAALPGDVLELEGGVWAGNFTLRPRADGAPVTLRSATVGTPATLRSPNNQPVLRTIGNASRWRFEDLIFAGTALAGAIVQLGDGLISDVDQLPRDIAFERCTLVADQTAKNGLEMNAADVTLRHCAVRGVKLQGVESHAIITYNSPGPFLIQDCTLEAGSCGFFVGGAKPAIPDLVPSDIVFRRNLVTRPLAMKGQTGWAVKNLFELKNARRVHASGNIFEHNWPDGQSGFAIVLTVRANSLTAGWTTIEDVTFESNIVRHVACAFNILGLDDQVINGQVCPSQPMDGVLIQNNLIYDLDRLTWAQSNGTPAGGVFMQIGGAPRQLHVVDNTAVGLVTGNILNLSGAPMPGFRFEGNIVQKSMSPYQTYGVNGNVVGEGNPAFATYAPDALFTGNVLAGCTPATYSTKPGNSFLSVAALAATFADPAAGNYRSTMIGAGVDQDALEAAQVEPPPPPPVLTTDETIDQVCAAATVLYRQTGGDVSPQAAALDAIEYVRTSLQLALD